MKGQIAISEIEVKYNKMGWTAFDFFKYELNVFTKSLRAGWYAYKKERSVYYFLWSDEGVPLNSKFLDALKKDGFIVGINAKSIEDAFR